MAQYDTITINGVSYPRPVGFSPVREDVYASEYMTMTGTVKADRVGWRYSDIELKWEALPQSQVLSLTQLTDTFNFVFDDPEGSHTEVVRRMSSVAMRHRFLLNGVYYWKNVSVKLSFINLHS